MVPRSVSVPTGSPQAFQVPHWFKWCYPDLRPGDNAIIVLAKRLGFTTAGRDPRRGVRMAVWERNLAYDFLFACPQQHGCDVVEMQAAVHDVEAQIIRVVRAQDVANLLWVEGGGA